MVLNLSLFGIKFVVIYPIGVPVFIGVSAVLTDIITDHVHYRPCRLAVFRGRGYASLAPPPDGVQPSLKEKKAGQDPPWGGGGYGQKRKAFLCALKDVNFVYHFGIVCNFARKRTKIEIYGSDKRKGVPNQPVEVFRHGA